MDFDKPSQVFYGCAPATGRYQCDFTKESSATTERA
jgi:hypothetical protein